MTVLHETADCDRVRNAARVARLARMSPTPKPVIIAIVPPLPKPQGVKTTPPPPPPLPTDEELRAKAAQARYYAAQKVLDETPAPTIRAIQAATCLYFKISYHDLVAHRRSKDEVVPRQIAMYLCRVWSGKALPEIGTRFDKRDHTTVLHSYRRVLGWLASNHENVLHLEAIENLLGVPPGPSFSADARRTDVAGTEAQVSPPPTDLPHGKTRAEHAGTSS